MLFELAFVLGGIEFEVYFIYCINKKCGVKSPQLCMAAPQQNTRQLRAWPFDSAIAAAWAGFCCGVGTGLGGALGKGILIGFALAPVVGVGC